jgi:hypothetical protein
MPDRSCVRNVIEKEECDDVYPARGATNNVRTLFFRVDQGGCEGEGVAKAEEDEKDEKAESDTDMEIRAKGGGWDHGRRGGNGGWGEWQKYDI